MPARILPVVWAALALAGCESMPVDPESAKIASELPIADLHLHPNPEIAPAQVRERLDRNGVRWAGLGAKRGGRHVWETYSEELGARYIAFAGQTELNAVYRAGGVAAMVDAENPGIQDLLRKAEEDLNAGRIMGIGEIFINNDRSSPMAWFRRKARTDAPAMRRFYDLVAKYDAFLTIHMEAHSDSVSQLEALLARDRRGRVLWNHCGTDASASQVRALLERNPNLFCELSWRSSPPLGSGARHRKFFDASGVNSDWLQLIEDFPDRFMIGTDVDSEKQYDRVINVVRRGLLPYLRPATARQVAYENAQRLFGLK